MRTAGLESRFKFPPNLCANDLQIEDVDIPEWGGVVRVSSFTGREHDAFEACMVRGEGQDRKVDRQLGLKSLFRHPFKRIRPRFRANECFHFDP